MKAKLIAVDSVRKWPRLLGRECELQKFLVGEPALINFSDGTMRTSTIKKVSIDGRDIHLHTKNSVYKFEKR